MFDTFPIKEPWKHVCIQEWVRGLEPIEEKESNEVINEKSKEKEEIVYDIIYEIKTYRREKE
ncbi:hypothetical protein ENUP19_0093G0034 [Entamoeba nuttalli]|uniref:Uncharacterized protein n=1 Tax=Entamoeba nuttalli TaxID=412467 RepID=A0ABQ0DGY9_9EUKA